MAGLIGGWKPFGGLFDECFQRHVRPPVSSSSRYPSAGVYFYPYVGLGKHFGGSGKRSGPPMGMVSCVFKERVE
jgi:hypothetical protein